MSSERLHADNPALMFLKEGQGARGDGGSKGCFQPPPTSLVECCLQCVAPGQMEGALDGPGTAGPAWGREGGGRVSCNMSPRGSWKAALGSEIFGDRVGLSWCIVLEFLKPPGQGDPALFLSVDNALRLKCS